MQDKMRKNWKQRAISTLICILACWLIYTEAMNLMAWYYARQMGQLHDNLGIMPTPLKDTSVEQLSGLRIEKFGFSLQVPWAAVALDRPAKSVAMMDFKDGGAIILFDPLSEVNGAKIMRGDSARQESLMKTTLGAKALNSNYEFMAAALQATPNEVKWWSTQTRNVRSAIMLVNKSMNLGDAKAVHPISSGTVCGFQYGDPGDAPYVVKLDLFDAADDHYEIVISGKSLHRQVISQSQINSVVASFHGLPLRSTDHSPASGE